MYPKAKWKLIVHSKCYIVIGKFKSDLQLDNIGDFQLKTALTYGILVMTWNYGINNMDQCIVK